MMQPHLPQIQQGMRDTADNGAQFVLMKKIIIIANRHIGELILKIIIIHNQLPQLTTRKSIGLFVNKIVALHCADVGALGKFCSFLQDVNHLLLFGGGVYGEDGVQLTMLGDC